jgi:electron transfer flavoprotein alpha subunit
MNRIRRDPREEREAATVSLSPRPRIDRAHRGGAAPQAAAAPPAPESIRIANPAYLVFAVADAPAGIFTRHDKQILGAARLLAGQTASVVLLAATAEGAGALGADRTTTLPGGYDPEAAAELIAASIRHHQPRHVLFPESADGGDLARRVAALLEEPLFENVESLSTTSAIRPATPHDHRARHGSPLSRHGTRG